MAVDEAPSRAGRSVARRTDPDALLASRMPIDQSLVGRSSRRPRSRVTEETSARSSTRPEVVAGRSADVPDRLTFEPCSPSSTPADRPAPRRARRAAVHLRPTGRAGDELTATLTVDSLRQIGGADIIGTRSEITDADGAPGLHGLRDPGAPRGVTHEHAEPAPSCPSRPTPSPAPTWSATPAPAATSTRSTGRTGSPARSGCPGVIAHGMFTMALAARALDDLGRRTGRVLRARLQVHQAGRRARRRRRRRGAWSRGTVETPPTTACHDRPRGHLRRREGARRCRRPSLPCLSGPAPTLPRRPAPRCGSAARPAGRARHHRGRAASTPYARPTTPGTPSCCVAGGSNLVVADDGFDGTVVRIATHRRRTGRRAERRPAVRRRAGHRRGGRALGRVRRARRRPRLGRRRGAVRHPRLGRRDPDPERRRLRPGGRPRPSPSVRTWDRVDGRPRTFAAADCGFGYRHQPLQARPRPLRRPGGHLPAPARRRSAPRSGTPSWPAPSASSWAPARRWPTCATRCSRLRAGKGMVLDAADHDTWSAGSFFTNPSSTRDRLARGCPDRRAALPQPDGTTKTSAAWLIEHAGFGKGYGDRAAGPPLHQAHARAHQPRRRHHRGPAGAGPRGARRGRGGVRRLGWSTSRSWSAAPCSRDPPRRRSAASQASMSVSACLAARPVRAPREAAHRHPGQLGEVRVGEVVGGPHGGVLRRPAGSRTAAGRRRRGPPCAPASSSCGSGTSVRSL